MQRTLETALSWDQFVPTAPHLARHPAIRPVRRSGSRVGWTAAACVATVVFCLLVLRTERPQQNPARNGSFSEATPGGLQTAFRFPVPMSHPLVADVAPIIVSTGPATPAKLGDTVAHTEMGKNLTSGSVRFHLWDWSKSDLSHVVTLKASSKGRPALLTPEGTQLLYDNGDTQNLTTGNVTQHTGFALKEGMHFVGMRFSSSGRFVAATIHERTEVKQVQLVPPLYSNEHWYAVRTIDLAAGKVLGEFPSEGGIGCFSADDKSFAYTSRDHVITRRETGSGKLLNEYLPALSPHGCVGIETSTDGRFIAAGHYHGEISIWELATGKLVLHHAFLRAGGERDTFFQPKVMQFSPDGELLAMASGSRLKVMELKTGSILKEHSHETTPAFVHLRWGPNSPKDNRWMTLVTYASSTEFSRSGKFPPQPTADILPRVFEWDWRVADPVARTMFEHREAF